MVLTVPSDFDKVQHYGVDCELHNIEVRSLTLSMLGNIRDFVVVC